MYVIWSQFHVVRRPSHQTRILWWTRRMCVNAYEIGNTGSAGCRSFLVADAADKNHSICVTKFTCHFASHAKANGNAIMLDGDLSTPPVTESTCVEGLRCFDRNTGINNNWLWHKLIFRCQSDSPVFKLLLPLRVHCMRMCVCVATAVAYLVRHQCE